MRAATHADIPTLMAMCEADRNAPHWTCSAYERLLALSVEGSSVVRVAIVIDNQSEDQKSASSGFMPQKAVSPDDKEWELENIFVDQQDRRHGAGSLLMRDLLAHVRLERPPGCYSKCALRTRRNAGCMRTSVSRY